MARTYLKEMRENSGLSMQDVAEKIGISRQYYQQIEAGERQQKMDITLVAKLSTIFNIPIEKIVDYENEKE